MNQNNSSSAYTDEVIPVDDFNEVNYSGEFQKLKCDNFQLRLMCYNYENTLSELECNPNDENEINGLKKSFYKKIELVHNLEENLHCIQRENFLLRKQLRQYTDTDNSTLKTRDRSTQNSTECLECKAKLSNIETLTDDLGSQIKCLEELNLNLQSSLYETVQMTAKPDTNEIGCCTENAATCLEDIETDSITDVDSDSVEIELCDNLDLSGVFERTLAKINKFLCSYNEGELKIANLETDLISTLRLENSNSAVIDDTYKIDLFKKETVNWETKCIEDIMQKCQQKIIDDDLSELVSGYDVTFTDKWDMGQVSIENPNILAIKSVVEKLSNKNDEEKILKHKIKSNKDWSKIMSNTKLANIENAPIKCLSEEFDIHIEKITDLASMFAKLIPVIKVSFAKTIEQLRNVKASNDIDEIKNLSENYQKFLTQNHEMNKNTFLDKCNIFIQIATDCILSLNKEKIFLNHDPVLFQSIENNNEENESTVEVEVIYDTPSIKQNPSVRCEKIIDNENLRIPQITIEKEIDLTNPEILNHETINKGDTELQTEMTASDYSSKYHVKEKVSSDNQTDVTDFDISNNEFFKNETQTNTISFKTVQERLKDQQNSEIQTDLSYLFDKMKNCETQTKNLSLFDENCNVRMMHPCRDLPTNSEQFDTISSVVAPSSILDEIMENENLDVLTNSNKSNKTYSVIENNDLYIKKLFDETPMEYSSQNFADKFDSIPANKLRRCFSVGSKMMIDHVQTTNINSFSFPNINDNNGIPINYRMHISNMVKKITNNDPSSPIIYRSKRYMIYNDQNQTGLQSSPISYSSCQKSSDPLSDDLDSTFEIISHLKLRMIKLLFIHDLRNNIQSLSNKNNRITTEFTNFIDSFGETESQTELNLSSMILQYRDVVNQWRDDFAHFNEYTNNTFAIPAQLLSISDEELVQMSFDRAESKLDFSLCDGDVFPNSTDMVRKLHALAEGMYSRYFAMDQLYLDIIERKQQILFQFSKSLQIIIKDQEDKMRRAHIQMEIETERYKVQSQNNLIEREKLESQIEAIRLRSQQYFSDLEQEKKNIQLELQKTIEENIELSNTVNLKVNESENEKSLHQKETNRQSNKITALQNEYEAIVIQNQNLKETIIDLKSAMISQKEDNIQNNYTINQNKIEIENISLRCKELEKENEIIRLHEKQLLINNNQFEVSIERKNFEIQNLQKEMQTYQKKLSENDSLTGFSEKKFSNKVEKLTLKIEELNKESLNAKAELISLNDDLNKERQIGCQLNISCQSLQKQLEFIEKNLELKTQDSIMKTKKLEFYNSFINELHENILYLINGIIELLSQRNSKKQKKILEREFDISLTPFKDNLNEIRHMKTIKDNVNNLLNILEKEIHILNKQFKIRQHDKLILEEKAEENLQQIPQENDLKNTSKLFPGRKLNCDKTLNGGKKRARKETFDLSNPVNVASISPKLKDHPQIVIGEIKSNQRKPVPTPRMCSQQLKDVLKLDQRNKNNEFESKSINNDPPIEHHKDDSNALMTYSSMSLNMDENQEDEFERSIISVDKLDTSQISEQMTFQIDKSNSHSCSFIEDVCNNKQEIIDLIRDLLSKLINESSNGESSPFNMKDLNELQDYINAIDATRWIYSANTEQDTLTSSGVGYRCSKNIDQLILTNRDLTENLIKATNRIIEIQNKLDVVNAELCQCQMAKHEMSIELVSKYEKISTMQEMINKYQTTSVENSKSAVQTTQINHSNLSLCPDSILPNSDLDLEDNDRSHHTFRKHCSSNEDTDSRHSNSMISRPRQNPQMEKAICSADGLSNSSIKIRVDGDLDDVTRTMIRCLTTLSEVQDSLITPPSEKDSSSPTSVATIFCQTPCTNNSDLEQITYNNNDGKTIVVAIIKEKKYQVMRQVISRIKADLTNLQSAEQHESDSSNRYPSAEKIKRTFKKLIYIMNNCFKIRRLSFEQWLVLTDKQEIHNGNQISDNFDLSIKDPLHVTEKVHVDFVRLQHRLERYQNRYKSLKHAVMANKYKLNDPPGNMFNEIDK